MPWPIFSISSISDLESFRKAIFYYQKIRRKILRRLHYELTARPYAPPSFVGEQRNVQNLCNNRIWDFFISQHYLRFIIVIAVIVIAVIVILAEITVRDRDLKTSSLRDRDRDRD